MRGCSLPCWDAGAPLPSRGGELMPVCVCVRVPLIRPAIGRNPSCISWPGLSQGGGLNCYTLCMAANLFSRRPLREPISSLMSLRAGLAADPS